MYNNVVVAVDLSGASEKLIKKALELVNNDASKLALIHVIEPIPASWGAEAYAIEPLEFQQRITDNAETKINELGGKLGIAISQQYVSLGMPAYEIRRLAGELQADAIVIGSHGYSGWKIMLGSTANKVLHGAVCDVLTVHVEKDKA